MGRETELEELCTELKENILSRLPWKPRTRLKCVSKSWCDIITRLRRFIPPTTHSGLVIVQYLWNVIRDEDFNIATFITVKDDQEIEQISSFDFSIVSRSQRPRLIDSCNGLLLYIAHCGYGVAFGAYFYVCSPILNWCRTIPPRHHWSNSDSAKIAFDDVSQKHFKVIHYLGTTYYGQHNCLIFYSETFQWREVKVKIFNLNQSTGFNIFRHVHGLYIKEKLYGIWSQYMMVHHVEREVFKLIKLPDEKSSYFYSQNKILWESEGHIYYCQLDSEGFHIWSYIDIDIDDDNYDSGNDNDNEELKWQFKQSLMLKQLELQSSEIVGLEEEERKEITWTDTDIRPLAFNDDLQILYLRLPHLILSYSFETRKMAKVWSYNYDCTILPFLFNPVSYLPSWGGGKA